MKAENVEISHPDKLLFDKVNITKRDIAEYFKKIAHYMLPYLMGRPLTLKQYPRGVAHNSFFQKHAPDHFPGFVDRLDVPMKSQQGTDMQMVSADEAADLVYFAGQNVVELHIGLSTVDDLKKPDQMIFDLDPSDNDFEKVRQSALSLKRITDEYGLPTFVKTSGSRGLHIHVPIEPELNFDAVKPVTEAISEKLCEACPDLTTLEKRKNKRGDKVFVDYLRNDYGMTTVAPYSLRGLPGAPVATPLDWDEVKNPKLHGQRYTLTNIFRRLAQKKDPWQHFRTRCVQLDSIKL